MTYAMTKSEAIKSGKALLKRMKTKGWKLRIWDNCGWHYAIAVNDGALSLYQDGRIFTCMIANPGSTWAGSYDWHPSRKFTDPNKSVSNALKLAKAYSSRVSDHLFEIELALVGQTKGQTNERT